MDLSRQEYPSMLASLEPAQAIKVLSDRLRHVNKLNIDVADWLQERCKIEEAYAQSLRRLAAKQFTDDPSNLGVFSTPLGKIAASADAIADAHYSLSRNIKVDVEQPLRSFASSNRELQAMSTIVGNLQSLAKDLDVANKKSEKLKERGGKAAAGKVANAASDIEGAQSQWDSQAPYVFERLQEADEIRCDNLRDALTQYQTHIIEAVSAMSNSAEDCFNALLNVQSADEIKTFALRTTQQEARTTRTEAAPRRSSVSASLAPPASVAQHDDGLSQRSSSFQERSERAEKSKSGFGGLKRLGTVIGRRKSTHPYAQPLAPEGKKSSSNVNSSSFSPFKKRSKEKHQTVDFHPGSSSNARKPSETAARSGSQPSETLPPTLPEENPPNHPSSEAPGDVANADMVNGALSGNIPQLQEPLQPVAESMTHSQPATSLAQTISSPTSGTASGIDAITQAEREAASATESSQSQFKVDIRNAPIEEEDSEASAAMANVATALRAQAAPRRSQGTLRGRRDRNTVLLTYSPNLAPEAQSVEPSAEPPASAPLPGTPSPALTPALTPAQQPSTPEPQQTPFKLTHRNTLTADEPPGSDTHSIRSGRSLASSASSMIKHPDMPKPGLNCSIVETVSAWFRDEVILRVAVIGELALAYNPPDLSAPFGTQTIRLNNFPSLDKVAPNPAFIENVPEHSGTYRVNVRDVTKTAVAFKYQLRLEESKLASHTPLLMKSIWKVEPAQASVLLTYGMHPDFAVFLSGFDAVVLSNVVLIVHLDPTAAKAKTCRATGGGIFSREKNLVYWRLDEVSLAKNGPPQTLKARFFTEGEARAGSTEARWEITNDHVVDLGNPLSVSIMEHIQPVGSEGIDPFADDQTPSTPEINWADVRAIRRFRAGTYTSSSQH